MPTPLHPQLLARLAGIVAVGMCLPWVVASIAAPLLRGTFELNPAPAGASTGIILGGLLLTLDQLTWASVGIYLSVTWPDILGLAAGLYWLFVGTWPIPWLISRERRHG